MRLTNFKQIEEVLRGYVPLVATYGHDGMTLERMWPLLKLAGNPHQKLRAVHISGTSGKTSTAYYIAEILRSTGKKVGLTVSPHVDSIAERIQINGQPMSEKKFGEELGIFLEIVKSAPKKPSYFELMIVFIYWEFVRCNVDYAVIETGMGGLLDGTNVITREDKVCVITDIGFDHMHILGSTLPEIASQKAGIIHENNQVFMYKQSPEVMLPMEVRVIAKRANLNLLSDTKLASSDLAGIANLPLFQQRNWFLAQEVSKYICRRDGLVYAEVMPGSVSVPGRMEQLKMPDGSLLIMDGAHNSQKMSVFVSSFKHTYPAQKASVMIALKKSKDFSPVIDALLEIAEEIIVTTFNTSQDLPAVSLKPETLSDYCVSKGIRTIIISDNRNATTRLLRSKSKIKLVTGSFYLLGQVRPFIKSMSGVTIVA